MMRSLRSRLIVGMLLGMAVLLAAAGVTTYTVQRRQLYRAFDDSLLSSANALAFLVHPGPFGYRFESEELTRMPAGRIRQGILFQFWSDQPIDSSPFPIRPESEPRKFGPPGREPGDGPSPEPPVSRSEPPPQRPRRGEPEDWPGRAPGELVVRSPLLSGADLPRLDAGGGQPQFADITMPDGTRGRAAGLEFELPARALGPLRIPAAKLTAVVAASTAEVEKQLSFLGALLAMTAMGTMAVSGAVAWLVVSRGLRPFAAVARQIAVMDETGLKQRLASRGVPREIEPVVNQLNGLLGRLDQAFDRERALTADVAHELRTPVAEIRTIAEITLSRLRAPEEYRQALGESLEAVRTLQGLIEKLLILARLEAGQMQPELQLLALKPLLAQHWAQLRAAADRRGVKLEDGCDPDALVSADAKLLDVILSNVLSNAATYVPDGGSITVESEPVGRRFRLSIRNTGCDLSEDQVAHVFDRFWRADAARSRSGLNCGLGLTLVRRAIEAMGGRAEARVSQERGFVLTLTFQTAEGLG
jgi:signal transduction histidine kinase